MILIKIQQSLILNITSGDLIKMPLKRLSYATQRPWDTTVLTKCVGMSPESGK